MPPLLLLSFLLPLAAHGLNLASTPVSNFGYKYYNFSLGVEGSPICPSHPTDTSFSFSDVLGTAARSDPVFRVFNPARLIYRGKDFNCSCASPSQRLCARLDSYDVSVGILSTGVEFGIAAGQDNLYIVSESLPFAMFSSLVGSKYVVMQDWHLYEGGDQLGPGGTFHLGKPTGYHVPGSKTDSHFFLEYAVATQPRGCLKSMLVTDRDPALFLEDAKTNGGEISCQMFSNGQVELCAVYAKSWPSWFIIQRQPSTKRVIDIAELSQKAPMNVVGAKARTKTCDPQAYVPQFNATVRMQINPETAKFELTAGSVLLAAWSY